MKTKKYIASGLLVTFSLIIATSLSVILYITTQDHADFKKDMTIQRTQDVYATSKLEFCINNKISPCDDVTINIWNDSREGDTFLLKSFEQLVEDGISTYKLSR